MNENTKVWHNFAVDAPIRYAEDANRAYIPVVKREPVEPTLEVRETFKHTKGVKVEEKSEPAPERKAAIPPHLRAKKVDAA